MIYATASVADDPRAHADYYIDVFGEVSAEDDPKVRRAHQVFEQVRNVAEDPIGFTPALKVINSDKQPWALALPDGYVILSRGALDICYNSGGEEQGDARLAFVLGHELAHLVSRDFWHRNVFLSLSGTSQNDDFGSIKDIVAGGFFDDTVEVQAANSKTTKRKELHADDAGFLYASLAGYQMTLIFDQEKGKGFLNDWVRQTRTLNDKTHLGPEERTSFLKKRFSTITAKVAFFKAGVQLAQFGRFRDAQYLFEAFAQSFPSHEVSINLGYVHLQQALQFIPEERRYQFWLPVQLFDSPELFMATRGLKSGLPPNAVRHFREAEKYFEKAANARRDDIPSRINLASVYFQLGEFYKARASVEEARALDESNVDALVLRALILNEQEKDIDMWPVATRLLRKLADKGSLSARYNLVRLYRKRGRDADAKSEWLTLRTQFEDVPQVYRESTCVALGENSGCVQSATKTSLYPNVFSDQNLLDNFKSPERLGKSSWETDTLQAGPLFVERFNSSSGDEILLIDGRPLLLTDHLEKPISTTQMLACCGKSGERLQLSQRSMWKYGSSWTAVVEGGLVTELWGIMP
jgi:tetratricopeptide (TPR) repeat protein